MKQFSSRLIVFKRGVSDAQRRNTEGLNAAPEGRLVLTKRAVVDAQDRVVTENPTTA